VSGVVVFGQEERRSGVFIWSALSQHAKLASAFPAGLLFCPSLSVFAET